MQSLQQGIVIRAKRFQRCRNGTALFLRQRQQQMLGRNILVLERVGLLERLLQNPVQRHGCPRLRPPGNLRQLRHRAVQARQHLLHRHAHLFEHRQHHPFTILQQRRHQVHRQHLRIAILPRQRGRRLHRRLRFHRKLFPLDRHTHSLLKMAEARNARPDCKTQLERQRFTKCDKGALICCARRN